MKNITEKGKFDPTILEGLLKKVNGGKATVREACGWDRKSADKKTGWCPGQICSVETASCYLRAAAASGMIKRTIVAGAETVYAKK